MKDLKIKGNPGKGNSFSQISMKSVGNYNPNAHTAITHIHNEGYHTPSRMDAYFQALLDDIEKKVKKETIDELRYYVTKLPGTKPVEEKLADGGFSQSSIDEAVRLKEIYAKRAEMYDCYPSAQQIILLLFARIKNEFNTSIYPLIEDGISLRTIMEQLRTKIVIPIMQELDVHGVHDHYLNFTEDHIYGMIYYLTGMCHLNWRDYDNV